MPGAQKARGSSTILRSSGGIFHPAPIPALHLDGAACRGESQDCERPADPLGGRGDRTMEATRDWHELCTSPWMVAATVSWARIGHNVHGTPLTCDVGPAQTVDVNVQGQPTGTMREAASEFEIPKRSKSERPGRASQTEAPRSWLSVFGQFMMRSSGFPNAPSKSTIRSCGELGGELD
jgi:hypothetical protein